MNKLPVGVLASARLAAVNYHDGPLPRYPGLNAPSSASIRRRVRARNDVAPDDCVGRCCDQSSFSVGSAWTPTISSFTLGARCYEAAIESFVTLVDRLERGDLDADAGALDNATRHLAHDRPRLFGLIDWSESVESLVNLSRALDFGPISTLWAPKALRRRLDLHRAEDRRRPGSGQRLDGLRLSRRRSTCWLGAVEVGSVVAV